MTKTETLAQIPDKIDEIADRLYARFVGSDISVIGQELRMRLLLEQNLNPGAPVPFGIDRLDVWQTAEYIGLKPETLRDRTKRRKLGMPDPFSIGKKLAWRRSELDGWIEGQRSKEVAALSAVSAASRGVRGTEGWPAENDVQWANAMQRSPANPRTMGSTYDAALAIGWAPLVTSAGNTGVALDGEIIAPSAAPATFCADLRPLPPIPGGYYSEADALRLFLERYLLIREGGTASYYLCDAEGRLVRTDDTSIEAELSNVYVWTGGTGDSDGEMRKAKPLFSWWKATTSRPQIRVAVFKPHGGVVAHEFNMWRGWGVEPLPGRAKVWRLLRHIRQIICRRDRRKFRYLMRWLAWTVQNPDKAPGVAVVLQSLREGAGKSTLSEVMVKIFGVHGTIVDTPDGLLGKHNDNLEFACFVAVEEAVFAGDKKVADQLKSRITSSSTTIEPKFKSRRSAPNRLHAMITTNHAWAAPAGDGARRWFVLSIGEEKVGDTSWFGPLFADLESGGYGQFLHLLLGLNIGQ